MKIFLHKLEKGTLLNPEVPKKSWTKFQESWPQVRNPEFFPIWMRKKSDYNYGT
jgi:hypothetical protein